MLRTTIEADALDAPGVVDAYKALAHVERDFRHLKVDVYAEVAAQIRQPIRVTARP